MPGGGAGYTVFLVLARTDSTAGVSGLQFGVSFPFPVFSLFSFSSYGDEELPRDSKKGDPWPASGSANTVLWDPESNCQRTVVSSEEGARTIVGAFYLYSYTTDETGFFSITADSTLAAWAFTTGLLSLCSKMSLAMVSALSASASGTSSRATKND